jgi:hypothetical protein
MEAFSEQENKEEGPILNDKKWTNRVTWNESTIYETKDQRGKGVGPIPTVHEDDERALSKKRKSSAGSYGDHKG